jgi:isopentenyl diphosphate isomerase/L-lactate dehydrogenase-like FMN-dependent dehydrogenase
MISTGYVFTDGLDASLTWEAITYLKSITKLPIWVKGIMTPQDAVLALDNGADAIFVSNHGGRQLDGAPPTLRVLESICQVVKGRVPVVRFSSPDITNTS